MSLSTYGPPPPQQQPHGIQGPPGQPPGAPRMRNPPPNAATIQKILDENVHLIQTIQDYQNKGKGQESIQ